MNLWYAGSLLRALYNSNSLLSLRPFWTPPGVFLTIYFLPFGRIYIDASLDGYQAFIEPIGRMNIEIRETDQELNSKYQSNQKYKVIDSFTMNTNAGSKKLYLLSDGSDTSIDVSECSNKICDIKSAKTNKINFNLKLLVF